MDLSATTGAESDRFFSGESSFCKLLKRSNGVCLCVVGITVVHTESLVDFAGVPSCWGAWCVLWILAALCDPTRMCVSWPADCQQLQELPSGGTSMVSAPNVYLIIHSVRVCGIFGSCTLQNFLHL